MQKLAKGALVAGIAILAACSSNEANNADANMMDVNATTTDMNATTDMNVGTEMNADLNAMGNADLNATDNGAANAATNNVTNGY